MKTKYPLWWIAIVLFYPLAPAVAEPPAASQPSGLELGSPYVDLFHGFGLTPPAGAERSTDRIAAQLVSWRFRDAKTNAILWTLAVGKIVNKEAPDDLDAYAKSLAAALKEKENFQLAASQVHEIAGHPAVDFKGHTESGKMQWWQRQVQIESSKGNFVLPRMTGPVDAAESMDATMTAVLATVKIIDPKEALAQREKNLKTGAEFLKTLTPERLAAALQKEPLYALSYSSNKIDCGGVMVQSPTESPAKGIEVLISALIRSYDPKKEREAHMTAFAFASADRASCSFHLKEDSEEHGGFVQSDWQIRRKGYSDTDPKSNEKTVPSEIRGCYLPPAFKPILTQFLDLKKPASYGFAVYTIEKNAFDVYTVTVIGSKKIDVGGKEVQSYRVDAKEAEDAPAVKEYYVDEKGRLIRCISDDGGREEVVDKEKLLKEFPKAVELIGKE